MDKQQQELIDQALDLMAQLAVIGRQLRRFDEHLGRELLFHAQGVDGGWLGGRGLVDMLKDQTG